jgi:hypothetical protein
MNKGIYFLILFLFIGSILSKDDKYAFIGTKACKKCHIKQFKSWKDTNMAKAFDLLKPGVRAEAKKKAGLSSEKDYTKDIDCLPCHTTGFEKNGGYVSLEETPQLVGLSCEMCHGAGGEYTKKQYMNLKNKEYKRSDVVKVGLNSPVTGVSCIKLCHNEKSPFFDKNEPFDFEKRKNEGTHAHSPLKYNHD